GPRRLASGARRGTSSRPRRDRSGHTETRVLAQRAQRPGALVANSVDMHRTVRLAASAALGYAIGSIPSGVLVGRLSRGIDVREHGSHSMGMANVLRTAGRGPAVVTLALDIGKGAAAARLGGTLGGGRGGGGGAGRGGGGGRPRAWEQ